MHRAFVVIFTHEFLYLFIRCEIPDHGELPEVFERTRIIDGDFDVQVRQITAVVSLSQVQVFCDGDRC
jgi:hypothetical protein